MNDKIDFYANEIVDKIFKLPKDTQFTMGEYFKDYNLELNSQFELMKKVLELCKIKNINIENIQANMTLGMPWVYKYKKNN